VAAEPAGGAALAVPDVEPRPVRARRSQRLPLFSLGVLGAFVVVALLAPLLGLSNPQEQSLRKRFRPPVWEERGTWEHPLGTDRLGRDMLSRIIWGARVSLAAGVVTVLLASAFGAAVGLVGATTGGAWTSRSCASPTPPCRSRSSFSR